jgi:hypothetical protein
MISGRLDGGQWQVSMSEYEGNLRRIVARLKKTGREADFRGDDAGAGRQVEGGARAGRRGDVQRVAARE